MALTLETTHHKLALLDQRFQRDEDVLPFRLVLNLRTFLAKVTVLAVVEWPFVPVSIYHFDAIQRYLLPLEGAQVTGLNGMRDPTKVACVDQGGREERRWRNDGNEQPSLTPWRKPVSPKPTSM